MYDVMFWIARRRHKIFKYVKHQPKWHIKGGLNYKKPCVRMHVHLSIHDPLDMYLKKLRKIFPNFPKKNLIENHHF